MHLIYRIGFCVVILFFCQNVDTSNVKNCTVMLPRLDVFKQQIISRRRRGIIFPKKAFLLLSQAFTKAIIDGRPPGVSYSIEFDMYSPLPDTVAGWQPTILNQRIKNDEIEKQKSEKLATAIPPTPPPTKSMMPEKVEDLPPIDFDALDTFPDDYDFHNHLEHEHHFEYDNDLHSHPHLSPRRWQTIHNITKPHSLLRQHEEQQRQMAHFYQQQARHFPKPQRRRPSVERNPDHFNFVEGVNNWPPREEAYESMEHVPEWKYHHGYRERRHLYEQLEGLGKIFNFNMKACIRRAMCELKSNLKPYGESIVEDIVRIILTIPKKLKFHDDYSFTQEGIGKQLNCVKHFKHSCPYRVLDFLTTTLGTVTLDKDAHKTDASGIVRKNTS